MTESMADRYAQFRAETSESTAALTSTLESVRGEVLSNNNSLDVTTTNENATHSPPVAGSVVSQGQRELAPIPKQVTRKLELPKQMGPKFTRKILPWVETYWHSKGRYPSNADFVERFGLELEEIQAINASKFWIKCLERRGITPPNVEADYLSNRQVAAIAAITNFHDVRPPVAKLANLGISEEELNGWYKNPVFKRAVAERADDALDNVAPEANIQLATLIKKGDFRAIKFYFEITGKAQSPEAINVKQAMQILIEAVQKHVSDPAVLQAIAQEVNAVRGIQEL